MSSHRIADASRRFAPFITGDDRQNQAKRLQQVINALWATSELRDFYYSPPIQFAHNALLYFIDHEDWENAGDWYLQNLMKIGGGDGIDIDGEREGEQYRVSARSLPTEMQEAVSEMVSGIVSRILASANNADVKLYDSEYPGENWHYRLLVGHLVLWPKEIYDARCLSDPFPWPWVIHEEPGLRPYIRAQDAATKEQERLASKINDAMRGSGRTVVRMPYGSRSKSAKQQNKKAAAKPKAMKPKRRLLAELVARLLGEDHSRTLKDMFDNDEFKAALKQLDIFMCAPSNLTKLMKEYSAETDWQRPKGKRDWMR